ncbi:MAG: hypothetical protein K8I02_09375, partial [Candidatus Methylomirabilis sp.]|nr:hypothetical protein [Deltaproteobacteria bacterium]
MRALAATLASAIFVSACGGGGGGNGAAKTLVPACPVAPAAFVTGETRAVFDLSGAGGFFDLPFPTDLRLTPDGHPDLTGFPNPKGLAIVRAHAETAARDNVGWETAQPIWIRFTGRLDAARLPRNPAAYASPAAPIQLVDVDDASHERGRRLPLEVRFKTEADSYRPGNLLEIHPVYGIEPREGTTYALLVTHGVCGSPQAPLAGDPALTTLLRGASPGGALGAKA